METTLLWKHQYAPREAAIRSTLSNEDRASWDLFSTTRKIIIIDQLEASGFFGGGE
jgi:hypothetical protein